VTETLGSAVLELRADASSLASTLTATETGVLSRFKGIAGGVKGAMLGAFAVVGAAAIGVGKALYDIGAEFDAAFDNIRIKTGATGQELEGLKEDFRGIVASVPTDFESASTAVAELNRRLDLSGQPLQHMAKQVLELSRLTGTDLQTNIEALSRLFGDWGIKTDEQGKYLNRLWRLSQETGVEVSTLSEQMVQFGSPLRQLGFDFDTAAVMFAKFEKEGVNVQTLMPGLRLGLSNLAQPTDELAATMKRLGIDARDPAKAFQQVMAEMEGMKSDSDRLGLAMQVFGKRAGADLSAAVEEGRFSFDKLLGTMRNGDETIRSAGRSTMDFSEQWQIFKNRAMLALEPVATRVFAALADGMKWLRKNGPAIMGAIKQAFLDVKPALTVLWNAVKAAFKRIVEIVKGAFQAIKGIIQFFDGLFSGDFKKMWEGIKNIFRGALQALKGLVGNTLGAIFDVLKNFVSKAFNVAKDIGKAIWDGIVRAIKGIGGFVGGLLKHMLNVVIRALNAAIGIINDITPGEINIPLAPNIPAVPDIPTIPYLAKGAVNWPGGWAVVGEEGPELVNLPKGADVHSNRDSRGMLGQGGGDIYADIYIGGEKIDERVVAQIRESEREANLFHRAGLAPG
jgi:TP901 family phage tail tape measure protein